MEKTVVIVDDSRVIAEILASQLSDRLGLRVVAVGRNGEQALSLYRLHRPDLMTLDLTMPVKDGSRAMREILAEFPEARLLMVTSQLGAEVIDCLRNGAAGYIEKPLLFGNREFEEAFDRAVRDALGPG